MRCVSGTLKADGNRLQVAGAGAVVGSFVACGAGVEPVQFRLGRWYGEAGVRFVALAGGVTTYRAESAGNKEIGKLLDCPVVLESLDNKIEKSLKWRKIMAPDLFCQ